MAQRCGEDQGPTRLARTWPGRTAESLGSRTSVWLWIDLGGTSQGRAQAVPMYLVPAVEKGSVGAPPCRVNCLGPEPSKNPLPGSYRPEGPGHGADGRGPAG